MSLKDIEQQILGAIDLKSVLKKVEVALIQKIEVDFEGAVDKWVASQSGVLGGIEASAWAALKKSLNGVLDKYK